MCELKRFVIVFAFALLMVTMLLPIAQPIRRASSNADKQKAENLIEANHCLRHLRNVSTYVAIGTVKDFVYKRVDNGIQTHVDISVTLPLTENVQSQQILTVWYTGGEVDGLRYVVNILWFYGPEDTVILPSVLKLEVGMSVLFFAYHHDCSVELFCYIPYSISEAL